METRVAGAGDTADAPYLIAIVEDDPSIAHAYRDVFEKLHGWRTLYCANGEEALAKIPVAQPDMILLDLGLPPGVDGKSVYRILQGHRATAHTPILIVTASKEWEVARDEFVPYRLLRKPCQIDELVATVEDMLTTSRAERTARTASAPAGQDGAGEPK